MGRSPNIGRILPQIAKICMLFSCLERRPMAAPRTRSYLAALELGGALKASGFVQLRPTPTSTLRGTASVAACAMWA